MRRKRHTEEKIIYALKQAESGTDVKTVCRQMEVSLQTFYAWKRKYEGLGFTEVKRLKSLESENRELKKLVANLSLDKHILQEVIEKKL